ncbi:hypothetical protein SAMN04488548_1341946 [Gordonia westfalica]|uniref:Uncharacterized protein n=1 Tax=Gordonia westfalica TaxID=158898 RepID=A0A1H2JBF7_9ACTN|nr:hypothetical protein [Gordonia westfalica]SDU53764.1 hypothetical protein SAMN04488548_1341946 [Gordonia westfalica]
MESFVKFMQTGKELVIKTTSQGLDKASEQRWEAAVDSGGRGEYAAALTMLTRLGEDVRSAHGGTPHGPDAAVLSLCRSTTASLLRQGGRHDLAHGLDGLAYGTVAGDDGAGVDHGRIDPVRAARADALIGLAADNLGLLRFRASARLLDRARAQLSGQDGQTPERWASAEPVDWLTHGRCRLRWEWVGAELGLYSGDAAAGLAHAEAADLLVRHLADTSDVPARYRLKTSLIHAAALAGVGETEESAARARGVVVDAGEHGLMPLEWAALSLLAGTGAASASEEKRHRGLRATLIGKGMALTRAE